MGWFYSWATPGHCLYRMSYDQLLIFWRQGWINQKMQALRIAGHMWGNDVDAATCEKEPDPEEVTRKQFEADFGMSYDEYLKMLPKS